MISIHAPLTGSDQTYTTRLYVEIISIHAPLTGSDGMAFKLTSSSQNFNPRSPYGERHSYRTSFFWTAYFNPRSPYGERRHVYPSIFTTCGFQSTLPLRGATKKALKLTGQLCISIHAPLTGSDKWTNAASGIWSYFNPRSPYGERLGMCPDTFYRKIFQSTLPLRGATLTHLG